MTREEAIAGRLSQLEGVFGKDGVIGQEETSQKSHKGAKSLSEND